MGQNATLGQLLDNDNNLLCYTLELPWKDNAPQISCIPEGIYQVIPHNSLEHPNTWEITGVPGRSEILIHNANFVSQLEGCIAVGSSIGMLEGQLAALNSVVTMDKLRSILPSDFTLEIK